MHTETDILEYEGQDWQVVSVVLVTPPLSMGEDEILYKLMDRHGQLRDVMDWELTKYNTKKGQQL